MSILYQNENKLILIQKINLQVILSFEGWTSEKLKISWGDGSCDKKKFVDGEALIQHTYENFGG